jgi:hypothetical protein
MHYLDLGRCYRTLSHKQWTLGKDEKSMEEEAIGKMLCLTNITAKALWVIMMCVVVN